MQNPAVRSVGSGHCYSHCIVGIYLCVCFLSLRGSKHLKSGFLSLRHTIRHLWVLQSMAVWKTQRLSGKISAHTAIQHQLTEFLALHICPTYKCDNTKVCVHVHTEITPTVTETFSVYFAHISRPNNSENHGIPLPYPPSSV